MDKKLKNVKYYLLLLVEIFTYNRCKGRENMQILDRRVPKKHQTKKEYMSSKILPKVTEKTANCVNGAVVYNTELFDILRIVEDWEKKGFERFLFFSVKDSNNVNIKKIISGKLKDLVVSLEHTVRFNYCLPNLSVVGHKIWSSSLCITEQNEISLFDLLFDEPVFLTSVTGFAEYLSFTTMDECTVILCVLCDETRHLENYL